MLKEIVDRLDPDRLMLPTSASGPLEALTRRVPRTTTTFTVRGNSAGRGRALQALQHLTKPASQRVRLRRHVEHRVIAHNISPANRKVTTVAENYVWRHHGEWWDTYEYREKPIFGELEEDEFELFVMLSQYMQAEGISLCGGGQPAQSVAQLRLDNMAV